MVNPLSVQTHPIVVTQNITERYGPELTFTYSRYRVARPGLQGAARRSGVIKLRAADVTADWLMNGLSELAADEELAWHSWVESKGTVFHIPMIDFVGRPRLSVLRELGRDISTEMQIRGDFIYFDTGESFHGYVPTLIHEDVWQEYLGRLLLLNQSDQPPVIDARWVGHALVRRFTALRWSHNTNRYKTMPHLISRQGSEGSKAQLVPAP